MSESSKTTVRIGGGSLPIIFLGASAIAYFNMPQITDSVTRVVSAGTVGLGSSVGCAVGAMAGAAVFGVCGLIAGIAMRGPGTMIALGMGGAILGAIGGMFGGTYCGYQWTKDWVVNKANSAAQPVAQTSQVTSADQAHYETNRPVSVNFVPSTNGYQPVQR